MKGCEKMQNFSQWLENFTNAVKLAFPQELYFLGLQGSYARGEASSDSDIDVVVLFKELNSNILKNYRDILSNMPEQEKICGFVGGYQELAAWQRGDLFQLYHDTIALYGDLDFIKPLADKNAAAELVQLSACNLYHGCCHNYLHARSTTVLRELYKAAVFAVQAKYYLEQGVYLHKHRILAENVIKADKRILQYGEAVHAARNDEIAGFDEYSMYLLHWCQHLIKQK